MKTIIIESPFWLGDIVYGIVAKPKTNLVYEIGW